jgi:glycine cleavage system T protein (aminomethyltransferase)
MGEHKHTRESAGLFDVSHMGQVIISGDNPAKAIETLIPGDIQGLARGEMRYSFLTSESGGILDDLIVTRREKDLFVVVNAGCKKQDIDLLSKGLAGQAMVTELSDRALIALQGPKAARILSGFIPDVGSMAFMSGQKVSFEGIECFVTRSGYTGEDGYEISMPNKHAEMLTRKLLAVDGVEAIGLGARDSLRLEAGLCLYGNDITTQTTPVSAALLWAIGKRRREEGGFPGADIILREITEKPTMKRVGILPEGKAPARAHTEIADLDGNIIGEITSGGFGPTYGGPIAMGYVPWEMSAIDTDIQLIVRGKGRPAKIARMPFVPQRYYRGN